MKTYLAVATTLAILVLVGFWYFSQPSLLTTQKQPTSERVITELPSLPERVGQLFIIGHWANTPTNETTKLITDHHLGGVIVMSVDGDARKIASWSDAWQASTETPLLIGIDQEGGLVSRLSEAEYIQTSQPNITTIEEAHDIGLRRGGALANIGINHNYSPVLDRSTEPDSFMYDRVFRDPNMIAGLADAMIRGYQNRSVIAVPKHYPGHPDTSDDSHITLPSLAVTDSEYQTHTQQFSDLIRGGNVEMLMTAHVSVPHFDPVYPTTLSPALITDLRQRIDYNGIIITDDLAMKAISDTWTYEEAAVQALEAGVDMIMLAAEPRSVVIATRAVIDAVESGSLSEARVNEAYNRVMAVKEKIE